MEATMSGDMDGNCGATSRIFSHSEDSCRNELHPHVCFPRHGFIYPFSFLRAVAAFFRNTTRIPLRDNAPSPFLLYLEKGKREPRRNLRNEPQEGINRVDNADNRQLDRHPRFQPLVTLSFFFLLESSYFFSLWKNRYSWQQGPTDRHDPLIFPLILRSASIFSLSFFSHFNSFFNKTFEQNRTRRYRKAQKLEIRNKVGE